MRLSLINARTAQTPGGTGALRVAAELPRQNTDVKRVWVSNPSWPNHKAYSLLPGWKCANTHTTTRLTTRWTLMVCWPAWNEAQAGDVVLFHGCCHNPTGIDPTLDQWQQLAQLSVEKRLATAVRFRLRASPAVWKKMLKGYALCCSHKELLVASSYSKTLACTTSASAPALWSPRIKRL